MASYNRIKAQKASPIGTIMPWTGSSSTSALTSDAIPKGWIVMRGQQLRAKDYPLLAQTLGNSYGPTTEPGQPFVGISNNYPNYNDDDVFNLPNLTGQSLIDLETSLIEPTDLFVIGQYTSLNGTESTQQPLTNVVSYIDVNFSVQVSSELAGKIKGIAFEDPTYFDTLRIIPRKLGIEHTAGHTHSRPTDGFYPSVELGGGYLGLFEAGNFEVQDSEFTTGSDIGFNANEAQADRFNTGTITWTAYDSTANSLPTLSTFRNYSDDSDVVPIVPSGNRTVGQYGNTVEYQDDNSCIVNVQQPAVTAPFPPPGTYLGQRNYYISDQVPGSRRGEGVTFVPPAGAVNTFQLFENLTVAPTHYTKALGSWAYISGSLGWSDINDSVTANFPLTGGDGTGLIVNATFEAWPDPSLATGGISPFAGDFALQEDALGGDNPNAGISGSGNYYAGAINSWAYSNDGDQKQLWLDGTDFVEEEFNMVGGSGTGMVLKMRLEPWKQPFLPGAGIVASTLEGYHREIPAVENDDDWTDGPGSTGWYNSDGMGNDDWFYSLDGDSAQYWNNYDEFVVATCRTSDGTLVAADGNGVGAEIRIRIEPARGSNSDSTYPPNSRWKVIEVVEAGSGFTPGVQLQCFFNTDRRIALNLGNTSMSNANNTNDGILRVGTVTPGTQNPDDTRYKIVEIVEEGTGYQVGDFLNFSFNTPRRINLGLGNTQLDPAPIRLDGIAVNGGSPDNTRYKINAINSLGEGYSSGNELSFPASNFAPRTFSTSLINNLFEIETVYSGPTGGGSGVTTDPEDYYGAVGAGRDTPYPTTLNHGTDAFTSNSLGSHNHFTVDLTMNKGQMDLPRTILINNMTTGNVEPINVDRGLSVQVNPNTPSLTVLYIIRAY